MHPPGALQLHSRLGAPQGSGQRVPLPSPSPDTAPFLACSPTEPLTVNATSFVGGDMVAVSWAFSTFAAATSDQIQASQSTQSCVTLQPGRLCLCTQVACSTAAREAAGSPAASLPQPAFTCAPAVLQLFYAPLSATFSTLYPVKFKAATSGSAGTAT